MKNFSREELNTRLLEEFVEDGETEEGEAEEGSHHDFRWGVKIMLPLIAVSILGFAVYAWRSDKIAISRNGGEARLIKAETSPLREKPEDPGGMYIANRDKQVYDAISSSAEGEKIVNVLPEAEQPVSRDALDGEELPETAAVEAAPASHEAEPKVAVVKEEVPAAVKVEPVKAEPAKLVSAKAESAKADTVKAAPAKPVEVAAAKPKTEVVVKQELMSKEIKVEEAKLAEVKTAEAKPAKDPKALTVENIKMVKSKEVKPDTSTKKASDTYKVQLGSFRSEDDVKTTWNKLKRDHADLFNGAKLYTEKADLGEKGVFYRLQVSGIKKESDARKICQKLNEVKQGCFVVKK